MITLKPCPFCGAAAVLKVRRVGDRKWYATCYCTFCDAQTESSSELMDDKKKCEQMAVDKWNKRVVNP